MKDRCLSSYWISISHTKEKEVLLSEWEAALASLSLLPTSRPIFTVLVGSKRKSQILRQLTIKAVGASRDRSPYSICLWPDKGASKETHPTVYVDFQLSGVEPGLTLPPSKGLGESTHKIKHKLDWRHFGSNSEEARSTLGNLLCNRVLGPFTDAICYFISDFEDGRRGIIKLLAEQARCEEPSSDIDQFALPTVFVVYDTVSPSYDCRTAESKLVSSLFETLQSQGQLEPEQCIRKHFKQIRVVSLRRDCSAAVQSMELRERLSTVKREVLEEKAGFLFRKIHLESLLNKMLAHFCTQPSKCFSFANATRPEGFSVSDFCYHLGEVIEILPEEKKWMSGLFCPIVNSAIMVASYPPGSHEFPMPWLYEQVFEPHVLQALIENESLSPITQENFAKFLKMKVATRFPSMVQHYMNGEDEALRVFLEERLSHVPGTRPSALSLHLYTLHQHRWRLRKLRTFRTCMFCLLRTPEKMLECGHSLCDTCIHSVGRHLHGIGGSVVIESCPLCGDPHSKAPFHFMPPTAGVRALCVDGGGIKGIIPLIALQHIWVKLAKYEAPLSDYFDFVCGTSAGGLISMGIFLMGWSIEKCIATFEQLAANTFKCRGSSFRIFNLVKSYIRDSQYSSSPIERAFKTHFGENVTMFNPLVSDTKVAVTAVTALTKPHPCIFSNYNGGIRNKNTGYTLVRAKRFEHEVNISEAATCTSAAPWFFKPVALRDIGIFQDGGLQHNNPINLARWEIEALWPRKPTADFMLSMGTGYTDPLFVKLGLDSAPARFAHRLVSNSMETMDGEKIHIEYRNGLSDRERERYHRINVRLPYPEPLLSDVSAMDQLKAHATAHLELPSTTTDLMDLIHASMFYFELDVLPYWNDDPHEGGWICSGHILCRMNLSSSGRRVLYERLAKSNAYFLIAGYPVTCIDEQTQIGDALSGDGLPPFRRLITFAVPDLDSPIGITLRGLVSRPRTISGLPKSANDLIKAQMLHTPFGRADGIVTEKGLPQVPKSHVRLPPDPTGVSKKRKYCNRDSDDTLGS